MLRRHREKSQAIKFRNRLDRKTPVGAALRDRRRNRVVRFGLVGVARRARTVEQALHQHARAGSHVPVDHQCGSIGEDNLQRFLGAAAFETFIAGPEHNALHAPPPRNQRKARTDEMLIILSSRRVDQVNRRDIALTAIDGCNPALTADRQGPRGETTVGKRADDEHQARYRGCP